MKVLQLIDSLEAGGAERMAVNMANTLHNKIEGSYLCASRMSGVLFNNLKTAVEFKCLHRKRALDLRALFVIYKWIKTENIQIIHAHGSSFFLGTLIKILIPNLKLVWHDHNGQRKNTSFFQKKLLVMASSLFDAVIVVNNELKYWAENHLISNKTYLLPNFVIPYDSHIEPRVVLNGDKGFRILSVANIRRVKDQKTLLKAFSLICKEIDNCTLHLVGKYQDAAFKKELDEIIAALKLEKSVYFYGQQEHVSEFIEQSDVCVISSKEEGLPLILLEYGVLKKAVISTNVGDVPKIIEDNNSGRLVQIQNETEMAEAISQLLLNPSMGEFFGNELFNIIMKSYDSENTITQLIEIYQSLEMNRL